MITDEIEYNSKLKKIETIFDAKPGTPEVEQLERLVTEVEEYEQVVYPIGEDDYYKNLDLIGKIIDENPKEQSQRWHYLKFIVKHVTDYESKTKESDDIEYRDIINRIKIKKHVMECLKDTKAESCIIFEDNHQLIYGIEWNDGMTCIKSCDFEQIAKGNNGKVSLMQVADKAC